MENDMLNEMLEHCCTTVPFYKNSMRNNMIRLNDFSTITKSDVSINPHNFISTHYLTLYEKGRLINKKTSGSTGRCLEIWWSHKDEVLASLEMWKYRKEWYSISIKDRYISFHTTVYYHNRLAESDTLSIYRNNNLSLSKNMIMANNIHTYFELIDKFNASWMFTQPSVLQLLLKYASIEHIAILNKLKYIELTGEYLSEPVIRYLKNTLPNVVFANMYGTTETNGIALECPNGHMHILNNAIVEVFDDFYKQTTSGEGNIVLTTIRNHAMPLIRYRIGDRGCLKQIVCKCGFTGQDIFITAGREGDIIISPDGNNKTCYSLLRIVEFVNDEYNNPIIQFNFVQDGEKSLCMFVRLKPSFEKWKGVIKNALHDELQNEFPAFEKLSIVLDGNFNLEFGNKVKFFEKNFI